MYQGCDDMAMIYSEVPCNAAGIFTTNLVKAAPVKWDQEIVYHAPSAQAVIINAGTVSYTHLIVIIILLRIFFVYHILHSTTSE